jgi:glycosyltransferase involved in cell wall biosynthesis
MAKKNKRNNNKQNKKKEKPFVSICTPTFNRRPFFETAIKCYLHQDYPKDKLEWIIIDDGSDKIKDLVKDISGVKYFSYDTKMTLGKKRNLMHKKSKGDIIVYMDDDDYYPPCRVSHSVEMLTTRKTALCAGSSEIYIWFNELQEMYQFGPYGPNHATAGTFAFKRELLEQTSYDENASLAEEKHFLKDYKIPFVQLEPKKTILVFSHDHNTCNKRKLLEKNNNNKFVKLSDKTVSDFVKEEDIKDFFTNRIYNLLKDYEPGEPKHKPDVLKQLGEIEERRKKMMNDMIKQQPLKIKDNNTGQMRELNIQELTVLARNQNEEINNYKNKIKELENKVAELVHQVNDEIANSETIIANSCQ